jgi:hypothetical protein
VVGTPNAQHAGPATQCRGADLTQASKPGPWPVFFPAITKQVVDLAIVPMMKIICRFKPSSWSR